MTEQLPEVVQHLYEDHNDGGKIWWSDDVVMRPVPNLPKQ